MNDDLKKDMLRVVASDEDDVNNMKNYLGLGMPAEEQKIVNEVLTEVKTQLQRAVDDFGSAIYVKEVENYLSEQGYESFEFWGSIERCISYKIDYNKINQILAKYGPTK